MKEILKVKDTDKFFDRLMDDEMFTCNNSVSGLNVRYNGVFTVIANPVINLIKISSTEIEIAISPGILLMLLSAVITVLFWAIGIIAIVKGLLNVPLIIITFLLPSIIWILQYLFNKNINKIIINELKKRV